MHPKHIKKMKKIILNMVKEDNFDKAEIEKIRLEFLGLIEENNIGYFISLERVYNWLENPDVYTKYNNDSKFRENFNARYLRGEEYMLEKASNENDLTKDYIMRKNGNKSFPWFSTEGFKTFCMTLKKEKKSYYVRRYFIQIEKDYLRVLKQSSEETQKELDKLKEDIKKSDSQLLSIKQKLYNAEDRADHYLEKNIILDMKLQRTKNLETILDDKDDFNSCGNPEYKYLKYLEKLHMKPINLYIINPKHMIKQKAKKVIKALNKSANGSDSDFEDFDKNNDNEEIKSDSETNWYDNEILDYEKPFNEYDLNDMQYEDEFPVLYYYIGGLTEKAEKPKDTYHKFATIYVKDKFHLKEIKDRLEKKDSYNNEFMYKTDRKWIYKVDYNTIKSIGMEYISTLYRELI
jgi:cell division septum initiation protein DivIVA